MADFDDTLLQGFIRNWFDDDEKVAKEWWEKLIAHPPTKELASVPTRLLVLLGLAFDQAYEFPANRADIYRQAIAATTSEMGFTTANPTALQFIRTCILSRKENLLSELAYTNFY